MEVREQVNHPHDVRFDNRPASFKKCSGVSIRPGGLVRGYGGDGMKDLGLKDGAVDPNEGGGGNIYPIPIQSPRTWWGTVENR